MVDQSDRTKQSQKVNIVWEQCRDFSTLISGCTNLEAIYFRFIVTSGLVSVHLNLSGQ